jgi:hypothetical protein
MNHRPAGKVTFKEPWISGIISVNKETAVVPGLELDSSWS